MVVAKEVTFNATATKDRIMILQDKVIVIGGVGEGIGHSLAVRAAAEGAKVVLTARTASRLESIAAEVTGAGGEALVVQCDMSKLEDCRAVAQQAMGRFGKIDGVSMIACMEPDRKLFVEADEDFANWRPIVDVNLWGTLQFIKQCLKGMSRGGSVAIVGSQVSNEPWPYVAAYAAAKAGLGAMVRSIAHEYGSKFGDTGIRFNMLSAGGVANAPYYHYVQELADFNNRTYDEQLKLMAEAYPLGYVPKPEEYADALIFLMSEKSGAVNGLDIHANGGSFMKS